MLKRGWLVQLDPETRAVTAARRKAILQQTGSTWPWAVKNLHDEVLAMGPYQDCSSLVAQVSNDRTSAQKVRITPQMYLDDSLPGIERVALIGEACVSLGLPTAGFTVQLDVSRALNSHAAVERAVAVFTSQPIGATVTQRGNHWDRCTELVLQWPRDKR
jgi:hypothetical protein